MMKLMPAVQQMLAPTLVGFGLKSDDLMSLAMQLQTIDEPSIKEDTAKLLRAAQGDLSDFE